MYDRLPNFLVFVYHAKSCNLLYEQLEFFRVVIAMNHSHLSYVLQAKANTRNHYDGRLYL